MSCMASNATTLDRDPKANESTGDMAQILSSYRLPRFAPEMAPLPRFWTMFARGNRLETRPVWEPLRTTGSKVN